MLLGLGCHYRVRSEKLGYLLEISISSFLCLHVNTKAQIWPKLGYKTHNWDTRDHVNAVIKCIQLLFSWLTSCSITIYFTITHGEDCIVLWLAWHFYWDVSWTVEQQENKPNCAYIQVNWPDDILPQRNYSPCTLRRINCLHFLMISKYREWALPQISPFYRISLNEELNKQPCVIDSPDGATS